MPIREKTIENGRVRGVPCGDPVYTVFKGIPYAQAPTGALRWRPPQPAKPFAGVYAADAFGCIAPQMQSDGRSFYGREFFRNPETMSEDCLYLNVWTPARDAGERLPVLFWIHGGALAGGYGFEPEFDGEGFCRRGAILVTINYRVGALGFMAHPELTAESGVGASGNYGHMDQIAALHWVRRNIAAFGGDPDNITVCGQSSGAISAEALFCSPLSRDAVAKAILQSAGGVWPRIEGYSVPLKAAEQMGLSFMQALGCATLAQMRALPWQAVVEAQLKLPFTRRFTTTADGYVLPDDPARMLVKGQYKPVPCLIGNNAVEMVHKRYRDRTEFEAEARAQYGDSADAYLALVPSDADVARIGGMPHIMGVANRAFAILRDRQGHSPAYVYFFDRDLPGEDHPGAFHSAELWYVFQTLYRCWRPMTGVDFDLSNAMASYWVNFAKTGDPNGGGLPRWTPYTREAPVQMELGARIGMQTAAETEDQVFTRDFLLQARD